MLRFWVLAAVAAVVLGASPAAATDLVGKVAIDREWREALTEKARASESALEQCYWNEENGIIPVLPLRVNPSRDIGVVLVREGAEKPPPDDLSTVDVHAGALERNVLVARPGSTIRFRNIDPFDHELYSPGHEGFEPERQSRNAFRPIEFSSEGVFEVRCRLMPHFLAYIVVTPATYVVSVDERGGFEIEDIAPGKYTVKVFHGGEWVHEGTLEVGDQREVRAEIEMGAGAAKGGAETPASQKGKEEEKEQ